jgi:flagellar biosynthesis chaperone FliJ
MTPHDLAQAAMFTQTTAYSLNTLMQSAHPDVRASIERAYRGTDAAALYLQALGRDKKENLEVASEALEAAQEQCDLLAQNLKALRGEKEKALKQIAPPAEGG